MKKWQYGHAIYSKGIIEANVDMNLDDAGPDGLGPFLDQVGEAGWELCGVLPYPSDSEAGLKVPTAPAPEWAGIFKRPQE